MIKKHCIVSHTSSSIYSVMVIINMYNIMSASDGPDTPQVTRTSSGCVGGGDTIVGQTVQLTCTSVSLPPALLSWQFNGLPLTASQANGGTLNLQIFSNNQSGQYTCSARNSITTQTSQQQISLNVVGELSVLDFLVTLVLFSFFLSLSFSVLYWLTVTTPSFF